MLKLTTFLLALTTAVGVRAQLSISNPNNPFDQKGYALRQHVKAANERFANKPCTDPQTCWADWAKSLSDAYHSDPSAYATVNTGIVKWEVKEKAYLSRITGGISAGTQSGMQDLVKVENDLKADYQNGTSSELENQRALLLIATNVKHMLYAVHTDRISAGPGSGPADWSDAAFDNCMSNAIDNANIFDILTNWGAGPGGWVLGTAADCARRQL